MAENIYTADSTHDGSTENVDKELANRQSTYLWHYYNDLDVNVTVTFYGTRDGDDDFSESVQIASETVSSGGNGGYQTLSEPWEQVRVEFSYASNPSSGTFNTYQNAER